MRVEGFGCRVTVRIAPRPDTLENTQWYLVVWLVGFVGEGRERGEIQTTGYEPFVLNGPMHWAISTRSAKEFRGGLVSKAHRWLYHSTLGSRVIEKKTKAPGALESAPEKEIVRVGGWGERLLF